MVSFDDYVVCETLGATKLVALGLPKKAKPALYETVSPYFMTGLPTNEKGAIMPI